MTYAETIQADMDAIEALVVTLKMSRPEVYPTNKAVLTEIAQACGTVYRHAWEWIFSRNYHPSPTSYVMLKAWEWSVLGSLNPKEVKLYKPLRDAVKRTRQK